MVLERSTNCAPNLGHPHKDTGRWSAGGEEELPFARPTEPMRELFDAEDVVDGGKFGAGTEVAVVVALGCSRVCGLIRHVVSLP